MRTRTGTQPLGTSCASLVSRIYGHLPAGSGGGRHPMVARAAPVLVVFLGPNHEVAIRHPPTHSATSPSFLPALPLAASTPAGRVRNSAERRQRAGTSQYAANPTRTPAPRKRPTYPLKKLRPPGRAALASVLPEPTSDPMANHDGCSKGLRPNAHTGSPAPNRSRPPGRQRASDPTPVSFIRVRVRMGTLTAIHRPLFRRSHVSVLDAPP